MALSAGTVLKDSLVLERELGAGGMGSVWIAHHQTLGSQGAAKFLKRERLGDEHAVARFLQKLSLGSETPSSEPDSRITADMRHRSSV